MAGDTKTTSGTSSDAPPRTTRPVRPVRAIADIEAIEAAPYDDMVPARTLHDLLRATAARCGDAMALTVMRSEDLSDIGAALTHRQLLWQATRAANMFDALQRASGVPPGERVTAFLTPTLPEMPALLLGAQIAGVASTLNYLLNREALFDLLDAQAATVLVIPAADLDAECWEKARGALERVPSLRRVVVIGDAPASPGVTTLAEALRGHDGGVLTFAPRADRDTVCALFHTGGTTGRPKLVRLTHGNQIHAAFGFAQVFGYDEGDVVINGFPFFHVGGTMTVGLSVLAAGGHVVVPSPYALRRPAVVARYWDIVRHHRATVVSGVPTSIAAFAETWPREMWSREEKAGTAAGVRMAVTGGALLPKAVGARFERTTGIRIFETYGMTETAAAIAFNPGRGEPVAGSVGFRAPYSEIRILRLDAEAPTACASNESGLVQVRGPQVFPGYLDPAHDVGALEADGWLNTGDIGYLTPDQRLVLTGRAKDLIVRGGHNIDPAAIEDVANQFDGVRISAAVGMPDQYAGEVAALFVVPEPGMTLAIDALRRHLEAHIHERPALPKSILLIDELPVTAVGKIFKPSLRERAIEEKVRLEVAAHCGPGARARVAVGQDGQGRARVTVRVTGATAETLALLAETLAPLPQSYEVEAGEVQAGDIQPGRSE
ncbi:AMP-binding protein [Marivibrio halodurans]|uniref:AMP-binding protein n=1 Tax=Marivibrio halodurans TaxID=2039722 RepID=A0A8J7S606_9PROT|nr:AMP-binding protein [Marivibrio halodurans]MBP5856222.1 AMP-binding protein [Marivibrio halodurans]